MERKNNISVDKFGRMQILVSLKDKKDNGYSSGFAEIKNQLYKFTVSKSKKDGVNGWLTISQIKKQNFGNF